MAAGRQVVWLQRSRPAATSCSTACRLVWACAAVSRTCSDIEAYQVEAFQQRPVKACWLSAPHRFIGEGFDAPALDTLFLAGPISYDGLLVQCAGRVIRAAPGKDAAEVHDYHDPATPILAASLQRRMPGYRTLGFTTA